MYFKLVHAQKRFAETIPVNILNQTSNFGQSISVPEATGTNAIGGNMATNPFKGSNSYEFFFFTSW